MKNNVEIRLEMGEQEEVLWNWRERESSVRVRARERERRAHKKQAYKRRRVPRTKQEEQGTGPRNRGWSCWLGDLDFAVLKE